MIKHLIILFFFSLPTFGIYRDFKTDKCTGWFNKTPKYDWSHCCIEHDLYIWAGGLRKHSDLSDLRLKQCVKKASNDFHSKIMFAGVRIGKFSGIKLKGISWANAWGNDADMDRKLTKKEIVKLSHYLLTKKTPLTQKQITRFLFNINRLNL